jgi:hypothetical protein
MTIQFTAITVGALLAAAKLAPRPLPNTDAEAIDSLLHRNAEAHADSPDGAVINVATVLADRIKQLNDAAKPVVAPAPVVGSAPSSGPHRMDAPPPVTVASTVASTVTSTVSTETVEPVNEAGTETVTEATDAVVAAEPEATEATESKRKR